ncbi:RVT 1 and/or Exo endo phos domain containing protein [Asbolus verrucosus]|uniref:RVT 1 and/or Exo endo phos domain containing protein n=1 Tax=Asbolus verrucosus TaxID=1661398 RepID=A0A482W798_ASBVE|nr:RVT 1 and/or Exo endo phos domain containing protein [Asbolus verrucosus]
MDHKINIATWNANGLTNKMGHVINFINTNNIDLMLINETKLKNSDNIKCRGYTIHRKDRPGNVRAGGVAIFIKNNIPAKILKSAKSKIENISVKLSDDTVITAAYNPPSNKINNDDLHQLSLAGRKVLIIGDFNARHAAWNCHRPNHNGNQIYKYTNTHHLHIHHTTEHTHIPSNNTTPTTIDLIINKNVQHIANIKTIPALNSDHNPVIVTLNNQFVENHQRQITCYKNADWQQYRAHINKTITLTPNIDDTKQLENEIKKFTNTIQQAKQKIAIIKTINPYKDHLDDNIISLIKTKNKLRKTTQHNPTPQNKTQLKEITKQITQLITEHKNKKWNDELIKLKPNDNTLWKKTNKLKKTHTPIPTLTENNTEHFTDKQKANILAHTFEKIHNNTLHSPINNEIEQTMTQLNEQKLNTDDTDLKKLITNPHEIMEVIKKLPNNKAPGPDGVENKLIKNLPKKAVIQLNYIINSIFKFAYFPATWKKATVIPIPKPNKNLENPTNYRPISLLNTLSKLTEKIILIKLNKFITKFKIIKNQQFGFRSKHNTVHQVARITNDIIENFNKNKTTAMIALDIQKAFDTVWIEGLIHKLTKTSIPTRLIKLIQSYLTGRSFRAKVNNEYSNTKQIRAGVPQGSVLGPTLFILYINDIPEFMQTKISLFADDTAIYASSYYAEVANKQLQIHLNILQNYYRNWKITINPDKTENIIFHKKFNNTKIITPLKINNQVINTKTTIKYLGVHLDQLNFKQHVKNAVSKAQAIIKKIYPLLKSKKVNSKNKKLIYTAIIRPVMLYAAPVWCKASQLTLKPLQIMQNKCLRMITNRDRYTRITTLHELTQLTTITNYINNTAQKFYLNTTHSKNNIIKNITKHRQFNTPINYKHKFTYTHLPIYNTKYYNTQN